MGRLGDRRALASHDPAVGTSGVLVRSEAGESGQGLAAILGLRLHGRDFLGDLIGNFIGLAAANFGIELDATNGLAAREGDGVLP